MARVLIVDDEPNMRRVLGSILGAEGHDIVDAGGVAEARRAFAASQFDLVVTDQRMPDGEGLALLASCREMDPTVPVVLITAYATVELAVDAMREGAFDVLPKPFVPDSVLAVVSRACERTELVPRTRLRVQVGRLAERPLRRVRAGDGEAPRADRPSRADQRDGADHRRDRERQGVRGPRDPRRRRAPSGRS